MNPFVRKILGPASFPRKRSQDITIPEVARKPAQVPTKFSGIVPGQPGKPVKPDKP